MKTFTLIIEFLQQLLGRNQQLVPQYYVRENRYMFPVRRKGNL